MRKSLRGIVKIFRTKFVLSVCLLLTAGFQLPGWAQERFIVTPNRGGADGARQTIQLQQETNRGIAQQVSITALETDLTSVSATAASAVSQVSSLRAAVNVSLSSAGDVTCGNAGMLLGPSHTMAVNRCLPSMTIAPTGRVVLTQGVRIGTEGNCDASGAGTLRYEAAQRIVQFCDGTAWQEVGAAPAASGPFTAVTGANPSTAITSNAVTVTGFAGVRTATATGGATIMVNGVAVGSTASVNPGDSVALRVTSSGSFDTAVNIGFSVTSISANWSVTTRSQDTTPNAFSFTNLTNQAVSTTVMSDVVTVAGFDGPLTASVAGQGSPQIQIAGGSWVASGSINPGQTLRLRLTTGTFNTTHGVSVSLGTFGTSWSAASATGSCTLDGLTVNNGASQTFYSTSSSSNCAGASQSRTCSNGTLSGSASFQYATCTALNCSNIGALASAAPGTTCSDGSIYAGNLNGTYLITHIGGCGNEPGGTDITAASVSFTPACSGNDTFGLTKNWSNSDGANEGATSMTNGLANTNQLIADAQRLNPAAAYCFHMNLNGQTDWYLPARDELNVLHINRTSIGGFSGGIYWSSSEENSYNTWGHFFSTSNQRSFSKNNSGIAVRCVRRAN